MALTRGAKFGPYEILSMLGAGGMGEVCRARDTALGRDVAIKILHPDSLNDADLLHRFRQEAQAAASLSHPNILAIYQVGEHEGTPYIVSELLEGRSSFESPWQNGVAERWVESCRGELLDHIIPLNEGHRQRLLSEYVRYYHGDRTHLGLGKGTPLGRTCSATSGRILSRERLGGLHHRYDRAA